MTGLIALGLLTINIISFVVIVSASNTAKRNDIEMRKSIDKLRVI